MTTTAVGSDVASLSATAQDSSVSNVAKSVNAGTGAGLQSKAMVAAQNVSNVAGFIIKYKDGTASDTALNKSERGASLAGLGGVSLDTVSSRHGLTLTVERKLAIKAHLVNSGKMLTANNALSIAKEMASSDTNIEYVEPNYRDVKNLVPNDTSYGSLWGLTTPSYGINAPSAWNVATGAGVTVAVIDTGIRPHADLAANILPGYDFIADSYYSNDGNGRDADASDPGDNVSAGFCGYGEPADSNSWHGTHVAGTVAAVGNNSQGVVGVAFNAKILPVRVLGKCGGTVADITDGMMWSVGLDVAGVPSNRNPAKVLNLSLGGYRSNGLCDTAYRNAITAARDRGAVVVVAAGNDGENSQYHAPANCASAITVAATIQNGRDADYSNYGSVVDVSAPGGDGIYGSSYNIYSTLNSGTTSIGADSYAWYAGTSMATPHVAGTAALLFSKNITLTPAQVEAAIKNTATPFPAGCAYCAGTGIVNAFAALNSLTADTLSVVYRFYNVNTKAHFFTTSQADVDKVIATWPQFLYEGAKFRVKNAPGTGLTPVYRFYNVLTYSHFYTNIEAEKAQVLATWPQFKYEGIVWYARNTTGDNSIPMYRFFRWDNNTHFYTVSEADKAKVIADYSYWYTFEGEKYRAWGL